MAFFLLAIALGWFGASLYGLKRQLPLGVSAAGKAHRVEAVDFLYDLPRLENGVQVREQKILQRILRLIGEARQFLVLDIFLLTDRGNRQGSWPDIAGRVVQALLDRKKESPALEITVITDEINIGYGCQRSRLHARLQAGGIRLVLTDLTRLRDSNFIYSGLWRLFSRWFGTGGEGWLPSPFHAEGHPFTLRAYLRMFNFKANHRKVVASEREAIITSANLDDASAFHANIAFVVRGGIIADIVRSEGAVAAFSGAVLAQPALPPAGPAGELEIAYLTEGKIKERLLTALQACQAGDAVFLGMFYLAEATVVAGLIAAAERGVTIRIVLDPNKDAFGRKKNGMPNRQVAGFLRKKSGNAIQIRWYDSHGEQFHSKLCCFAGKEEAWIIGGSANLTRRNLDDFNLESCLAIRAPVNSPLVREVLLYFEGLWGSRFTLDPDACPAGPFWKTMLVRGLERSGMCTF